MATSSDAHSSIPLSVICPNGIRIKFGGNKCAPSGELIVYLHRLPVDFRKAINGLSLIVQDELHLNHFAESLFVFTNKARNHIKLFYWERNGFCLWQKRLEKNKFVWSLKQSGNSVTLSVKELNWLLDGFDIWRMPPHEQLFYDHVG